MAKNKKNTTKVNGKEFYTDENGNILGEVQPSYNYETVTKSSKDTPYIGPTNTPAGSLSTKQASERAAEQVLNEAAVNPEEADAARALAKTYEKSGVNVDPKTAHKIVQNLSETPENNSSFQTPDSIAAKTYGVTGKAEDFSTPGEENTKAMEDSMNKRTENEKIEQEVVRDNPGASDSEIANTTNMKKEQKDAEEKATEDKPGIGESFSSNITQTPFLGEGVTPTEDNISEPGKAPEEANLDFSDYISNFYGPKNGADYLKSLWSQGAGGKAAAIGNVLGNILGATGKGLAGKDYTSDWQTYKDNYTKEMAERNQKAFDQNMDISKQLRTNDVARNEMLKTLENYQKIGKGLDPEKFENIRKALTATGKGSQIDYYLASVLGELSGDPAFMEAAKEAGENAVELLGNLAQFSGNTIRPLNWFFGQAGDTMNNMFGGK